MPPFFKTKLQIMSLELKKIEKKVGIETHIHSTNLKLEKNTINVLLGSTLAGKTTLMQIMAGLDKPTSGEIWFNGENVTGKEVQKRNCSMVYQQFINYPNFTVFENIASPLKITGVNSKEIKERIARSTAHAYDLVLNGLELGGGSLRIHQAEMQREVLRTVGLTDNQINEKFGFLIEALEMGAPPHGGIAFGVDRITMLILGEDSIRETIAFPKNQQAKCLLTNAPSNVSKSQLKELDIEITIDE